MLPFKEVRAMVKIIRGARIFDGTGAEPIIVNRLIAMESEGIGTGIIQDSD